MTMNSTETQARPISLLEAATAFHTLRGFIGRSQIIVLSDLARGGEECQYFRHLLTNLAATVACMPATHESTGTEAKAYLHYFTPGADFYIVEKDIGCATDEPEDYQSQAYGLADLGYGPELGYISLPEILAAGAELDLCYTPQTIAEIMGGAK